MNFKEELLKAKNNQYPEIINNLLNNGIIQECEMIDNIYYIEFGFLLKDQILYNYKKGNNLNFRVCEKKDTVIYAGGLAVDNQGNIIKGIIYPFYINSPNLNEEYSSLVSYECGIPQIINKVHKLNLNTLFCYGLFRAFNLLTDSSTTWSEFYLGKEDYEDTYIPCDSLGNIIAYPDTCNVSYFGNVTFHYDKIHHIKTYKGEIIGPQNSVPISHIEKELDNVKLQSTIASRIYCAKETSKATIESAEKQKEGMKYIGASIMLASQNIRQGVSNIANALNQHPDIVYYF